MRASDRFIVSTLLMGLVAGCSLSSSGPLGTGGTAPTGTITFSSPAGGETFQIGDTVVLAWSCPDCANVPAGDYLGVFAYDGQTAYLVDDSAALNDSTSWVVGTSLQNGPLPPGTYQMVAQDAALYYQAQSRFFQVVGTP